MEHIELSANKESSQGVPHLRRVLSFWDLYIYGIVSVTPSAPITIFGLAYLLSAGHAVDTVLIGMVAMVLTAASYGRMASLYPGAGSAFTYVGRGLNPFLGFLTGWAMLLDYLLIPLFCVTYGTLAVQRVLPGVPFFILAAFFAGIMTFFNLLGIRSTARTNKVLVLIMLSVLILFILLSIIYLFDKDGIKGLLSIKPFYNRDTFDIHAIASATSLAALTYLGFDAVTTLAEEVTNPRKNVMRATVLVCLSVGLFGGFFIYLAQLVWPDYKSFTNIETAFFDVAGKVGGNMLFQAIGLLLLLANIGSGLTGQVGAARLLFGMGRDNLLPRKVFAYLGPRSKSPTYNILIIGIVAYIGSLFMKYEFTAHLLNFGAFLGFMGVNFAAFWQLFVKNKSSDRKVFAHLIFPLLGFLFCLAIWLGLSSISKMVGSIWFLLGLIFIVIKTKGFKRKMIVLDFSEV